MQDLSNRYCSAYCVGKAESLKQRARLMSQPAKCLHKAFVVGSKGALGMLRVYRVLHVLPQPRQGLGRCSLPHSFSSRLPLLQLFKPSLKSPGVCKHCDLACRQTGNLKGDHEGSTAYRTGALPGVRQMRLAILVASGRSLEVMKRAFCIRTRVDGLPVI